MGAQGTTTVDFGAFPGACDTSVAVTGQTSIIAGSLVEAWLRPVLTADHSVDEHLNEPINIIAGNIVAGTGFTIYAQCINMLKEQEPRPGLGRTVRTSDNSQKLYGLFTVAWVWN